MSVDAVVLSAVVNMSAESVLGSAAYIEMAWHSMRSQRGKRGDVRCLFSFNARGQDVLEALLSGSAALAVPVYTSLP